VKTDHPSQPESAPTLHRAALLARVRALVRAIREGDDAMVEEAVLRLSRSRRWLAPLALVVGAFTMLFEGLRLVFSNWRLTLIQILPAMWIWLAMLDLKVHVLHGHDFHVIRGPVLIPVVIAVAGITAASFYLNATFAFAISADGSPDIRRGFDIARSHMSVVLAWGIGVGLLLAFATMIVTRWGRPWFGIVLSLVVGLMMVCYVGVPARLVGVKRATSRRDKLAASAVSGSIGAVICTPPYVLGRIGLLMLGSHALLIPGIFVVALGFVLQAGATGAVKAIKMSASLAAGRAVPASAAALADQPDQPTA
jgi:uncharacterized membrane protein